MQITENMPVVKSSEWQSERSYSFVNPKGETVLEVVASETEFPKSVNLSVKSYLGFDGESKEAAKISYDGIKNVVDNILLDYPELRKICAEQKVLIVDDGKNWVKKALWVNERHLLSVLDYHNDLYFDQPLNVKVSEIYLMLKFLEKYIED